MTNTFIVGDVFTQRSIIHPRVVRQTILAHHTVSLTTKLKDKRRHFSVGRPVSNRHYNYMQHIRQDSGSILSNTYFHQIICFHMVLNNEDHISCATSKAMQVSITERNGCF